MIICWLPRYFHKFTDKTNLGDLWGRLLQINSKNKKRIVPDFGDVHNNVIRLMGMFENSFSRSFEQTVIKTHITTVLCKARLR